LKILWDNMEDNGYSVEHVRPQFKGEVRKSPITGQREEHFPDSERLFLYI